MRYILPFLLFLTACATITMDTSIPSVNAGDVTLISACDAMPGRGADICRFKDGMIISSSWKLLVPNGDGVKSGYVVITYKDVTKQYPISGPVVEIPLKDIIGQDTWNKDRDSFQIVQARARVIYKGITTDEEVQVRGFALIVVTDTAYDPIPIDSGLNTFNTNCKIQYTTAGRSALQCTSP